MPIPPRLCATQVQVYGMIGSMPRRTKAARKLLLSYRIHAVGHPSGGREAGNDF